MNAPVLNPPRRYTAEDIFYLIDTGLIDRSARFELIDGALIPMSPKGRHHEVMRERIATWLKQPWAQAFNTLQEHTLQLADGLMLEPDFLVYDASRFIADANLAGPDLRLVIEVADSSLTYDLNTKAPLYAEQGVREYWVIDAVRKTARVHRVAAGAKWTQVQDIGPGGAVEALCAPGSPLRLA
jgi:Uma2 family endonuclease